MFKWVLLVFFLLGILIAFFANRTGPERAVEGYFRAASLGDAARLEALSCSPEMNMNGPITRMPDYAGENLRVAKMGCNTIFREGGYAIVECASEVYTAADGDEQLMFMAGRSYHLSQVDGNWCVYGYNQP